MLRESDPLAQTLSLIAGLAMIEALDVAAPGRATLLKWPNDVLLDGGKLAGILLERAGQRVAIGFGVNLAAAPAIAGRQTVGLDGALTPQAFAPLLAGKVAALIALWRTADPAIVAGRWLARAHPPGSRLRIHADGGQPVAGTFDGIDVDGALRLHGDDGAVHTIRAGDVEL